MSDKRIEAAAWLIDTTEDRLLSRRDYGADGLVVIGPDGRKHVFTDEQIQKAIKAMHTPRLRDITQAEKKRSQPEAPEAVPEAQPTAEAHAPKPEKGLAKRGRKPKAGAKTKKR